MIRIKPKIYAQALYEVCQQTKDLDLALRNFVVLLGKHNRVSAFKPIMKEFNKIYNLNQSNRDVLVETAEKLDAEIRDKITALSKDIAGVKNVQLMEKIDNDLIGGVKISIDDLQIDDTLKRKLHLLKINLTK